MFRACTASIPPFNVSLKIHNLMGNGDRGVCAPYFFGNTMLGSFKCFLGIAAVL